MSRVRAADIGDFLKRVFTLWMKSNRGRGYVSFGKFGLTLVALGVSVVVPGLWEMVFEFFARAARPSAPADIPGNVKVIIAVILGVIGLAIIGISFRLYHRSVLTAGPSTENDEAISINVRPETSLERLIGKVAEASKRVVIFDGLATSDRATQVAAGPLRASDFEDFLRQVAQRTTPPLNLKWDRGDNLYRLST